MCFFLGVNKTKRRRLFLLEKVMLQRFYDNPLKMAFEKLR